ncbi:MAG: hypothetical protein ACRCTS_05655 [Fusobacteriaceae bacterium]
MKKIFILLLTLVLTITSMASTYHRPGRPLPSHRPIHVHRPIYIHRPIHAHRPIYGHGYRHDKRDAAIAGLVVGAVAMAGIVAVANANNNTYYPRPVPRPYYGY